MAITVQDLIRFGLVQDPKAYLESETKRWTDYYNEQIGQQRQSIESARTDAQYNRGYERLDRIVNQREQRFSIIDQQYNRLLKRQDEALESPVLLTVATQRMRQESEQKLAEQKRQLDQRSEELQRTAAERESSRARSRRAGGGSGRAMLAGYSLSVPEGVGGRATLGRPVQTGGSTGMQSSLSLGRSVFG